MGEAQSLWNKGFLITQRLDYQFPSLCFSVGAVQARNSYPNQSGIFTPLLASFVLLLILDFLLLYETLNSKV